jgi:hypothetical protein
LVADKYPSCAAVDGGGAEAEAKWRGEKPHFVAVFSRAAAEIERCIFFKFYKCAIQNEKVIMESSLHKSTLQY